MDEQDGLSGRGNLDNIVEALAGVVPDPAVGVGQAGQDGANQLLGVQSTLLTYTNSQKSWY